MGYISAHRTDRSAKHGSVVVIFHDIIVVEINELRKSANPFCEGNGTRPFGRVLIHFRRVWITFLLNNIPVQPIHAKKIANSLP